MGFFGTFRPVYSFHVGCPFLFERYFSMSSGEGSPLPSEGCQISRSTLPSDMVGRVAVGIGVDSFGFGRGLRVFVVSA